jgi:hypothetical protein
MICTERPGTTTKSRAVLALAHARLRVALRLNESVAAVQHNIANDNQMLPIA